MADGAVIVKGLKPLLHDFSRLSKDSAHALRAELASVAAPVAIDVKFRLGPYGAKTVRGVRIAVRQRGVAVQQSARKSRDLAMRRGNFGALQQLQFDAALDDNEGVVEARVERFLDRLLEGDIALLNMLVAGNGIEVTAP